MADAALDVLPLRDFVPVWPVNATAVIGPYVDSPEGAILVRRPPGQQDTRPVDIYDPPSKKR